MAVQTYQAHARQDPKFHFVLIPLCLLAVGVSIRQVVRQPTPLNWLLVLVTITVLFASFLARVYALQNQNRLIRLEERLRLARLKVEAPNLTTAQLIALRFASDSELPELAARASSEQLTAKQIKAAVTTWRPDYERI